MPAERSFFSSDSVISSLALATISPVSGSTMLRATMRPTRKSSGTLMNWCRDASSWRMLRGDALVLLDHHHAVLVGDVEARDLPLQAFRATKASCAPESIRRKLSNWKKFARICSGSGRLP